MHQEHRRRRGRDEPGRRALQERLPRALRRWGNIGAGVERNRGRRGKPGGDRNGGRNANGRTDPDRGADAEPGFVHRSYNAYLMQRGLTQRQHRQSIRESLLRTKVRECHRLFDSQVPGASARAPDPRRRMKAQEILGKLDQGQKFEDLASLT